AEDPEDAPLIEDRGAPQAAPQLAVLLGLGERIAIGVAVLTTGGATRDLPRPLPGQTGDIDQPFPHRYSGVQLRYRRRTLLAGAALRASSWLGVGVSLALSQVRMDETRHIWAGTPGLDEMGGELSEDLVLSVSGDDDIVPGVSLGVLIAPPEAPVEMAMAASYTMNAELEGTADLQTLTSNPFPLPELSQPGARTELAVPLVIRAGLRYLGERFLLEAGAELAVHLADAPVWQLSGVSVRNANQMTGAISELSALVQPRDHGALRLAADVEIAPGFLWLSAGYAYRSAASDPDRPSPVSSDRGGHTLAIGAEGYWNGMTLTIGYSRTLTPTQTTSASEVVMIAPFDPAITTVGEGRYGGSRDTFGAAVEIAWE
ncbi:MAG: hypothetical protein AAGC55_30155, partial [Myxococcota bacterium]